MRRAATAAILAIATVMGSLTPALAQAPPGRGGDPVRAPAGHRGTPIPTVGVYLMGGMLCAAAAPMIGTVMLNREMTLPEVQRSTLSCFLGPVGWVLGPSLFPDVAVPPRGPGRNPPSPGTRQTGGRNISIPSAGQTNFVRNEVLVQAARGASTDAMAARLQLTLLETQTFTLGGTVQRWRIDGNRPVGATLGLMAQYPGITAQPNYIYILQQPLPAAPSDAGASQYIVDKLHLTDVHRISNGDNVLVAVIDSQIDTGHPDLAGVIAGEHDVLGTPPVPHSHGTAMAGAIAAHSKLIGVAPKVRLLAVRAFTGEGESAQSTTFNILKGIDWAAANNARVINMSFAGPPDAMVHTMLGRADARGIILIAAVGNAGPGSPPLFPAADPHVIGVTATDADDKLLPQANRGPQVAVAAPGVEILAVAPNGRYQLTSGTSVAAAHVSGLVALLLARKAGLTPTEVRRVLLRSAHKIAGKRNDFGAGVIDPLGAVNALR